ncbi:LuxR C-terminal-related transcriptional regulator [Amycolatopsis sp. YIM 10]|uniref:helix-turn-helix transcriptional regulator n=1 Tax=Amycolatopsis sp. YIM 10 TaxID=2653857 RepID=UPI0012A78B4D|nr:LuxR C-terminal-related transcriptional regulator [Amycolatopsis sp. YIM 10]QFU92714.1 Bacterial regulatory protein, LuxR family [Amycolatopsis sp. YIM 10]
MRDHKYCIVVEIDRSFRIGRTENRCPDWFSPVADEFEGRDIRDLVPPGFRARFGEQLTSIFTRRTCCTRTPVITLKTGKSSFRASLSCTLKPFGDTTMVIATIMFFRTMDLPVGESAPAAGERISETSARVLEGVAAGVPSKALALRLHLSQAGIDYHVNTLLRRFDATNRTALVARAYSTGTLKPGVWPPRLAATHAAAAENKRSG